MNFLDKLHEVDDLMKELFCNDPYSQRVEPDDLREAFLAYPLRKGKALRPALLMWSCGLFGGAREKTLHVAAGIELYHIWTLVHDDIIDNDDHRRGAPSAHILLRERCLAANKTVSRETAKDFGINLGILCGDIQQAWANSFIIRGLEDNISAEIILAILYHLNQHLNPTLISGEAQDVAFSLRSIDEITPEEMKEMLRRKTGALFRFAAECGAMIALSTTSLDNENIVQIGDVAETAALAFQLKDDLLGMVGDELTLGKPVGSDLQEGKRNFLFSLAASRLHGEKRKFFLRCLGKSMITKRELEEVQVLLQSCGAIEALQRQIHDLLEKSKTTLNKLPKNSYRNLLHQWIDFIEKRKF